MDAVNYRERCRIVYHRCCRYTIIIIILAVAAISLYSTYVYTDVVTATAHATTNHQMSSIRPKPPAADRSSTSSVNHYYFSFTIITFFFLLFYHGRVIIRLLTYTHFVDILHSHACITFCAMRWRVEFFMEVPTTKNVRRTYLPTLNKDIV